MRLLSAAQASNPSALRKKYLKDDLVPIIPAYASQSLRNLLLRLLKKDPKERMVFSECACCDGPVQQKEAGLTLPRATDQPMSIVQFIVVFIHTYVWFVYGTVAPALLPNTPYCSRLLCPPLPGW